MLDTDKRFQGLLKRRLWTAYRELAGSVGTQRTYTEVLREAEEFSEIVNSLEEATDRVESILDGVLKLLVQRAENHTLKQALKHRGLGRKRKI